jgi:hypothetical protein
MGHKLSGPAAIGNRSQFGRGRSDHKRPFAIVARVQPGGKAIEADRMALRDFIALAAVALEY